jgi:hypothetical protein
VGVGPCFCVHILVADTIEKEAGLGCFFFCFGGIIVHDLSGQPPLFSWGCCARSLQPAEWKSQSRSFKKHEKKIMCVRRHETRREGMCVKAARTAAGAPPGHRGSAETARNEQRARAGRLRWRTAPASSPLGSPNRDDEWLETESPPVHVAPCLCVCVCGSGARSQKNPTKPSSSRVSGAGRLDFFLPSPGWMLP